MLFRFHGVYVLWCLGSIVLRFYACLGFIVCLGFMLFRFHGAEVSVCLSFMVFRFYGVVSNCLGFIVFRFQSCLGFMLFVQA